MDFSSLFGRLGIPVILAKKQQQLCDDLLVFEDSHERLAAVVNRARQTPAFLPADRIDENRVRGCISAVWLAAEFRDGRCYFRCDADGPLVKGLVALLCDFFSGATPGEIAASPADPLAALQLIQTLSPTRRHGVASARAAIDTFARQVLKSSPSSEDNPAIPPPLDVSRRP